MAGTAYTLTEEDKQDAKVAKFSNCQSKMFIDNTDIFPSAFQSPLNFASIAIFVHYGKRFRKSHDAAA
jgi:hypothetical protein